MPGPVFKGQCVREIVVPKKSVVQYDCERCKRPWYEDKEVPVAKLIVELQSSSGASARGSFDVLCKGCEKTVTNAVASLLRDMKKASSTKSRAKKEDAVVLSEPTEGSIPPAPGTESVRTPPVAALRQPPSAPSKRQ